MKECQTLRERNDTASKIALNVRSSWLSLRSSIAALQVAKTAIAQADENLRQTTERYREQVVTNTEVLDAERYGFKRTPIITTRITPSSKPSSSSAVRWACCEQLSARAGSAGASCRLIFDQKRPTMKLEQRKLNPDFHLSFEP